MSMTYQSTVLFNSLQQINITKLWFSSFSFFLWVIIISMHCPFEIEELVLWERPWIITGLKRVKILCVTSSLQRNWATTWGGLWVALHCVSGRDLLTIHRVPGPALCHCAAFHMSTEHKENSTSPFLIEQNVIDTNPATAVICILFYSAIIYWQKNQ